MSLQPAANANPEPPPSVVLSDSEWRAKLSPEQFRILRQAGTERPFGPAYAAFKEQGDGAYHCAGCGNLLFASSHKFDAHCGWPAFWDPAVDSAVLLRSDTSLGMTRTEVVCAQCHGHLGHLFVGEGFDTPTDQRFCINGAALQFVP
jgi:peptide-methionine (R)-S-oxide reductase